MSEADRLHPQIEARVNAEWLNGLDEVAQTLLSAVLTGRAVQGQLALESDVAYIAGLGMVSRWVAGDATGRVALVTTTEPLAVYLAEMLGQALGDAAACVALTESAPVAGAARVVAATPDRLADAVQNAGWDASGLTALLLYRLEELAGPEFETDLQYLLMNLPACPQTVVLTESWPEPVPENVMARLAEAVVFGGEFDAEPEPEPVAEPVASAAVSVERPAVTGASGEVGQQRHRLFAVPGHLKLKLLRDLLSAEMPERVVVFVEGRYRGDRVVRQLAEKRASGLTAFAVHSGMNRAQQERAVTNFLQGRTRVLVVTIRALRWIKLPPIEYLINFALPARAGDYMRQARRVKDNGVIINLVSPDEAELLAEVRRELNDALSEETLAGFDYNEAPAPGSQPESRDEEPPARNDRRERRTGGDAGVRTEAGRDRGEGWAARGRRERGPAAPEPAYVEDNVDEGEGEILTSWRSRSEVRTQDAAKMALEEYSPPPMPDIWQRPGKFSDVTSKPRLSPEKFPLTSASPGKSEGDKSGSKRSKRRRRGRKGGGGQGNPAGGGNSGGGQNNAPRTGDGGGQRGGGGGRNRNR